MHMLWMVAVGTLVGLLVLAGVLHLLPRLGAPGRAVSRAACRAPLLDAVITVFTVGPMFVGPIVGGWWGLVGGVLGQVVTVWVWCWLHEAAHPGAWRGPRIVKVLNALMGRWRNHAALWAMAPAVPVFWLVRLAELTVYPALVVLAGLPRYRQGEWVNLSRQKFEGLVGHDLIWCLYCDWMTGIWSMGTEMLRNIESLWCPIRFAEGKKCEHCAREFPDVSGLASGPGGARWVDAEADIAEAAALVDRQYAGRRERSWFGHPTRLTIEGQPPAAAQENARLEHE